MDGSYVLRGESKLTEAVHLSYVVADSAFTRPTLAPFLKNINAFAIEPDPRVIPLARQQKLRAEVHVAACRELSCRRIRDAG